LCAAAVLCTPDLANLSPPEVATLVTPRPQWAFAMVGRLLYPTAARPQPLTGETGVSPRAFVSEAARLEENVVVEAGAAIGPGAAIGAGSVVAAHARLRARSPSGRDLFIRPPRPLHVRT